MNNEKYIAYSTEEFVLDDDFMCWVLHPDEESDRFWAEFLLQYPEKKEEMDEAAYIIRSIRVVEPLIASRKSKCDYHKKQAALKPMRKIGRRLVRIAAVFVLLVTLGGVWYYYQHYYRERFSIELADGELSEKGRVILPDGTISEFETKETKIQQTVSGKLTINSDTILLRDKKVKSNEPAMTQDYFPYGNVEITLSDGTKYGSMEAVLCRIQCVTGNTGSYFSEKLFRSSNDRSKPFYVITNDLRIKVTGTRFNVTI